MIKFLNKKRGQSTAEYAVLIGLVVAAAIAVQVYVKRGVQARFKVASDGYINELSKSTNWVGIGGTATASKQWEMDKFSSRSTLEVTKDEQTSSFKEGGKVERTSIQESKQAAEDYQQHLYADPVVVP